MSNKYSEAMASVRHYSNLRFAIMTVFVAITGALLNHIASSECVEADDFCGRNTVRAIGIWVAVVFLVFECALNYYIWGYSKMAADEETESWSRHPFVARLVELASVSVPLGVLYIWLCKI